MTFGLFAIRRSDTTNHAMFDPDFCGALFCEKLLQFFVFFMLVTAFASLSPQNRFKGPMDMRFTSPARTIFLHKAKKEDSFFNESLVAEKGFEPHDLRVMSPTSYQTAPLRDIMVPEAGVEPVREKISRDFKSRASANSAIPA